VAEVGPHADIVRRASEIEISAECHLTSCLGVDPLNSHPLTGSLANNLRNVFAAMVDEIAILSDIWHPVDHLRYLRVFSERTP